MAAKKGSEALSYIVTRLKNNPQASYGAIKEGAEKKGLTIYPVMYGRAKLLLGQVKPGKKKRKTASKRGPGRPRKSAARRGRPAKTASPIAAVQELMSGMREQERDNDQLRSTLEKIRELIDRAL
jgi:hypothetical protein